jgi:hypothetical protein
MIEIPQATEHHKKLHRLAGSWQGEEKLSASPWGPGGIAQGGYTMRVDIDGLFVIQDYVQAIEGKITYRGHGVFGWNAQEKLYTWYWVDSMGQVPFPSLGLWEGDTLQFQHGGAGDRRGRYTYKFESDDSFSFQIDNSLDAGKTWLVSLQARYKKV